MTKQEPRQTTANLGLLKPPSYTALHHGLNQAYYSIAINYRKNDFEMKMLENLNREQWSRSLKVMDFEENHKENEESLKKLSNLALMYNKWIQEEIEKKPEELVVSQVGRINPKNHLKMEIEESMSKSIVECLGTMMNTEIF